MTAGGPAKIRVLVIDDDSVDRELVRRLLTGEFEVLEAATAREGRERYEGADCVLLDHRLPDSDGLDLLPELLERCRPVLVLTGHGSERIAVEAMKRGACDYLPKEQLTYEILARAIRAAIETTALRCRVQRQQAELEASYRLVAERESRLRLVLEQVPAALWTTDGELRYSSMSGAGLRLLGVRGVDIVGRKITAGEAPTVLIEAHRKALEGTPAHYDLVFRERTLKAYVEPLRDQDGVVCGVVGVALDVSDAVQLELELGRAQKMEALGQLTGGVVHDFNNILTAIKSFSSFVFDELHEGDPKRDDLREVLNASDRAVALVRQLLVFSQRQPVAPQVVEVGQLVRAMLPMLRRLLGDGIELQFDAHPRRQHVHIDAGRLEQVIVNLVVNARDAMLDGGTVTIDVGRTSLDESISTDERRLVTRGDYVVLSVTDEGTGITDEVRERIFEPFFTTKGPGHGTGLGLTTSYGIVQQAGGSIVVYSEPGLGSTFRVYLPRASSKLDSMPVSLPGPAQGGDETILVVEDDPQVCTIMVRALARYGYRVLEARSAEEAEHVMGSHVGPVDVIVADVILPRLWGPDMVRRLRTRQPEAKALFISGYAVEAARRRGLLEPDAKMLEKPFTAEGLARAVREVLDG